MKKTMLTLSLAAIAIFVMIGCVQEAPKKEAAKVAAKVNGKPLTEAMVQDQFRKMSSKHSNRPDALASPEMRTAIIDTLVGEMLVLEGAVNAKIVVPDKDVDAKLDLIKKQLGQERFMNKMGNDPEAVAAFRQQLKESMLKQRFADSLVPEGSITEDDAKKIYTGSPVPYLHQLQLQVRFIQSKTFEASDRIMKDIEKSGFVKVADGLEKSGAAMVSGYGWTTPGMYTEGISDGLRELEAGETGGPYEGKQGYYIFYVNEKKPERPKSFDEAKAGIMSNIYKEKKRAALAHWLAKKRSVAQIEIIDEK